MSDEQIAPDDPDSLPKAYPLAEGNREATATVVPKTSLRSPLVPAFGGSLRSGHNSLRQAMVQTTCLPSSLMTPFASKAATVPEMSAT